MTESGVDVLWNCRERRSEVHLGQEAGRASSRASSSSLANKITDQPLIHQVVLLAGLVGASGRSEGLWVLIALQTRAASLEPAEGSKQACNCHTIDKRPSELPVG